MGKITADAAGANLDRVLSPQGRSHVCSTTAEPAVWVVVVAVRGDAVLDLRGERLILEIKGKDGLMPVLPYLATGLALVVQNVVEALVVSIEGCLLFVEVARSIGIAVRIASRTKLGVLVACARDGADLPIGATNIISIVWRDNDFDSLLRQFHNGRVQSVQRGTVVGAKGRLEVGNRGGDAAVLGAIASLCAVHPQSDDFDTV